MFDIKTAFLYGHLEKPVYMSPPPPPKGVDLSGVCAYKVVVRPQASTHENADGSVTLGLCVDDGVVVCKDCRVVDSLLEGLEREFEKGLHLNQTGTMAQLLEAYNMTEAKPAPTPAVEIKGEEKEGQNKTFLYRELLGSLVYLCNKTRPDIEYAVKCCSRSVENPTEEEIVSIKRILRYLQDTENLGIRLAAALQWKNWLASVMPTLLGTSNWCARKQPVVDLSTAEAEYIAAAECTKELMYLKAVLEEVLGKEVTASLHVDNQSALSLKKNGVLNRRSKHTNVRFHYIHEKVSQGLVKVRYCSNDRQKADICTKLLPSVLRTPSED
ncbi:hypothetical protein PR048_027169 [Dryococelus australis]|uniref:Reverse transcriptase Ty1/copia-type domain-containing protein n=1 Tax=Dryococelus australis TaxID=614101 RepID=A0ABQ9GGA3_9NEOP|nr:hypothetical protein PR048_027169 [Dryococelus australis]